MPRFREKFLFRHQAFTLIELLVVISIIALLLAILIPGLGKVRETGRRIYCGNTLKSIGQANFTYVSQWNGYIVPFANPMRRNPTGQIQSIKWCENPAFLKLLFVDTYKDGSELGNFNWPKAFVCPSDKNTLEGIGALGIVLMSYGCNYYGVGKAIAWSGSMIDHIGCKIDQVAGASDKIMYAEGVGDWWVSGGGANHIRGWDRLRYSTNQKYREHSIYGGVAYRHNEGVNVLFFDGHVEYLKKEKLFGLSNTGIWTAVKTYRPVPILSEENGD